MSKSKPIDELKNEYFHIEPIAKRFCPELVRQIEILVEQNKIQLGFPIQARIKSWGAIEEKLTRVGLKLRSISDLQDLVGIRLIFLFKRDADKFHDVVLNTFEILKQENTKIRLREDQFGYSSLHYVVKLPKNWLIVPAMASFGEMKAEIQIRTMAQHLWADASHTLQYKNEENVPESIKRSIYRVSAILETVDLEFEKVLNEREIYRKDIRPNDNDEERLNTDLLEIVLDSLLPPQNKGDNERYDELLVDLNYFKINKVGDLKALVKKHLNSILEEDIVRVEEKIEEGLDPDDNADRILNKNVFYIHTGLTRCALEYEFKDTWRKYNVAKDNL